MSTRLATGMLADVGERFLTIPTRLRPSSKSGCHGRRKGLCQGAGGPEKSFSLAFDGGGEPEVAMPAVARALPGLPWHRFCPPGR